MDKGNVLNNTGSIAYSKRSDQSYNQVKEGLVKQEEPKDWRCYFLWNNYIDNNQCYDPKDWAKLNIPLYKIKHMEIYRDTVEKAKHRREGNLPVQEDFLEVLAKILFQAPHNQRLIFSFSSSGQISFIPEKMEYE